MAHRKNRHRDVRLKFESLEDRRLLAAAILDPVADTYSRSGVSAGSAQILEVRDFDGGDFMAYVRFDKRSLNVDQIMSAELTLHKVAGARYNVINSGRFDVAGLLDVPGNTPQTWDEITVTQTGLGAEYLNTSGDGLDAARTANLDQESGANVVETVDNAITAQKLSGVDLVTFLNDRVDADGFVTFIARIDANGGRGWGYASRDHADSGLVPTLEIEYTANPLPLRQVERLDRGVVGARRCVARF